MATITANTGANNWNTNGAWVGAVQPTAADDVVIPASATVTIPTATTALGRSVTNQASGAIAFATTSSLLNIGDGTAGAGNVAFSNAGTITLTGVGVISFISTSTTQQTITTGGVNMPSATFNGAGGSWTHSDAWSSTGGTLTWTQGTWTSGNKAHSFFAYTTASGTKTITCGTAAMVCTGTSVSMTNGGTLTTNTATLTISGASATFSGGGNNGGGLTIIFTGGGTMSYNGNSTTNYSVTVTGTASKLNVFTSNASSANSINTLTINGASVNQRVLWQGVSIGTPWPVSVTTLAGSNYNVQDITLSGGASPANISAITGGSGDYTGNTNFTFTTGVTRYAVVAGNFSDTATWSSSSGGGGGSTMPLPQDTVFFDANSAAGTYTMDEPWIGKDVDFTGFTRTASFATASTPTWVFGSLTWGSAMTISGTQAMILGGRGTHTLTSNGKQFTQQLYQLGPSGTYTQADDFSSAGNWMTSFQVKGTWTTNNFNVTVASYQPNNGSGFTLNGGTSLFTLTATSATLWSSQSVSTINMSTATLKVSAASASTRTINLSTWSYGTLDYTVAGSTGQLNITGTPVTINTLNFSDATNARTLQFAITSTYTINNLNVNGTAGKLMTIQSSSAGTAATIICNRGPTKCNYLSVKDSTATGDKFYAINSTNVSGNTGWIFNDSDVALNNYLFVRAGNGMSVSEKIK